MPQTQGNGSLDFRFYEEKAKDMTVFELHAAILDIRKTLPIADARDRELGTHSGGVYRDEASVYHQELTKRSFELSKAIKIPNSDWSTKAKKLLLDCHEHIVTKVESGLYVAGCEERTAREIEKFLGIDGMRHTWDEALRKAREDDTDYEPTKFTGEI